MKRSGRRTPKLAPRSLSASPLASKPGSPLPQPVPQAAAARAACQKDHIPGCMGDLLSPGPSLPAGFVEARAQPRADDRTRIKVNRGRGAVKPRTLRAAARVLELGG